MFWEAISNTRKSVSLDIKTLRSWLRKTRVALRFSTHFSVYGHLMKLSSLCLIYYFKGNSRLVLSDSSLFFRSYTILKRPIALAWKVYHVVNNRELKQPRRRRQQKRICIFDNIEQYFCTLCTCIFYLLTLWRRVRSFYDVKWPVLQLWGRRQHMMTNVQFCLLMSQPLVPI